MSGLPATSPGAEAPFQTPGQGRLQVVENGTSTEPRRPRRVLVVDDSRTIREQLRRLLRDQFECECASGVEEALALARARPPDVIVSDVLMEPLDGLQLCLRVRAEPVLRGVAIILITSTEAPDGKALGLESGADDFVNKPVRPRELLARVRSLAERRVLQQQLEQCNQELASARDALLLAQRQVLEAEKTTTFATVAGGFAHEINNPLAVVASGVNHLVELARELAATQGAPALQQEVEEVASDVVPSIERITRLIRDLGTLSSQVTAQPVPVDVLEEVRRALLISKDRLEGVDLELRLDEPLSLLLYPGYLTQLTLSLLSNALDAVVGRPGPRVRLSVARSEGGVELRMEDNGAGMTEGTLAKAFEPFFTTKATGEGAGLGLATCYALVRRLGGDLRLESRIGSGTVAVLSLRPAPSADSAFVRLRGPQLAGAGEVVS